MNKRREQREIQHSDSQGPILPQSPLFRLLKLAATALAQRLKTSNDAHPESNLDESKRDTDEEAYNG